MSLRSRITRWSTTARAPAWDGTAGRPPSGNGASSCHLFWALPPGRYLGVEADLEVLAPPAVPELYFWALQANFTDGRHPCGGAHLGLQWFPPHPGATAVNWGGYGPGGGELAGTDSALPSATANPHTRDYPWRPGRRYRLAIRRDSPTDAASGLTPWQGSVEDVATGDVTVVRHLLVPGHEIDGALVWSEVFARCDDPPVHVRWSGLAAIGAHGERVAVRQVSVNYQSLADGGCTSTDSTADEDGSGVHQHTGVVRRTPAGTVLRLAPRDG